MQERGKLLLSALAGALLVVVLAVVVATMMNNPAQAQPSGVQGMRQITVIGQGEASGKPDTAHVEIGVETTAPTTNEALSKNNVQVTTIISKLQELGIASEDIQTNNFSIHPTYDEQGRDITGYTVNNNVSVTIRNLDQAGTLLDEVVQVGANRIYGMNFSVDDPSALITQARTAALEDARTRAQQLAQASGATVGDILIITEDLGSSPVMPLGRGGGPAMEQAQSSVPIEAGEQTFNASVQVTFEMQ
jgi:hypothetical protein